MLLYFSINLVKHKKKFGKEKKVKATYNMK